MKKNNLKIIMISLNTNIYTQIKVQIFILNLIVF